jgi:hypothetical protein
MDLDDGETTICMNDNGVVPPITQTMKSANHLRLFCRKGFFCQP